VAPKLPFSGSDRPQEKRCRIAVKVEIQESASGSDILLAEVPQERTLAASRFSEHRDVHRAPFRTDAYAPARDLPIGNPTSDVKISLRREIAPQEFFEEFYHPGIEVRCN
jgi:hypothetical protein